MSEGVGPFSGYLLDSHVLLWWWFLPERLSSGALALLQDPASRFWVSTALVSS
jgi:PIN domain nuclease of toxin-antitoxin system